MQGGEYVRFKFIHSFKDRRYINHFLKVVTGRQCGGSQRARFNEHIPEEVLALEVCFVEHIVEREVHMVRTSLEEHSASPDAIRGKLHRADET